MKKAQYRQNELVPKGIYATINILGVSDISILYIIILIVLLSDIVSGEYSPNTIKMSLTKPISRKKL